MSTFEQSLDGTNQAINKYNTAKLFLWNNRYDKATFSNASGDTVTLAAGTLMGRIATTQKVVALDSSASDGSQFPVGILASDYIVEDGDSVDVTYCVAGDVAEELVILAYGDEFSTAISGRSIRDRIASDTVGIKLVTTEELTDFDNE
jgi:hypothetical protein